MTPQPKPLTAEELAQIERDIKTASPNWWIDRHAAALLQHARYRDAEVVEVRALTNGDWIAYHDSMLRRIAEGNDRAQSAEAQLADLQADVERYRNFVAGFAVRDPVFAKGSEKEVIAEAKRLLSEKVPC